MLAGCGYSHGSRALSGGAIIGAARGLQNKIGLHYSAAVKQSMTQTAKWKAVLIAVFVLNTIAWVELAIQLHDHVKLVWIN